MVYQKAQRTPQTCGYMVENNSGVAEPFQPLRPDQELAVRQLRGAIRMGAKCPALIAPTGGGKTRVAVEITKAVVSHGFRVLFIAPRRNLVAQTWNVFSRHGIEAGMIMAGIEPMIDRMVQVASIDTIISRVDRPYSDPVTALNRSTYFIFDEMHLYTSPERSLLILNISEGLFGPGKIIIGMTATPCTTDGKGLSGICDKLVIPVTMQELIDAGHLLQPIYYSGIRPDLSREKIVGGDYTKKGLGKAYNPVIIGNVVDNWVRLAFGTSTVFFTPTRANAQYLFKELGKIGVSAAYLDAFTDDDDRRKVFEGVASGAITAICNVGIVGLGTDIPRLQTVVFATATKSIAKWMQGCGRASRLFGDQQNSIIIDHGGMVHDPSMGPVEYITDWSLDPKTKVQDRVLKRQKQDAKPERQDVTCKLCGRLYKAAHACPGCGHVRPAASAANQYVDRDLERVITKPEKKPDLGAVGNRARDHTAEQKQSFLGQLLYIRAGKVDKGKACSIGWVYHTYKAYYGQGAQDVGRCQRIPPSAECLKFVTSLAIKHQSKHKAAVSGVV